jgi:hypothetical protein
MERRSINPSSWSIEAGFDQAQLIDRAARACARQPAGHPGRRGHDLANIVRLNCYTTDVDELFKLFPGITDRFGGSRYATSVLGVAHLPAQLLVMLEATAVD